MALIVNFIDTCIYTMLGVSDTVSYVGSPKYGILSVISPALLEYECCAALSLISNAVPVSYIFRLM